MSTNICGNCFNAQCVNQQHFYSLVTRSGSTTGILSVIATRPLTMFLTSIHDANYRGRLLVCVQLTNAHAQAIKIEPRAAAAAVSSSCTILARCP
jgi:hypothetical protein